MTKIKSEPKSSYFLKSVKQKLKPVMLKFNFGINEINPIKNSVSYKPLVYNTGLKIEKPEWNDVAQIPKSAKYFGEIEEVKKVIYNTYNHLINQNLDVSRELLKMELDIIFGRAKRENHVIQLTSYIQSKIIDVAELDKTTIKQYMVLIVKIKAYEEENNVTLTSENLDRLHYLNFQKKTKAKLEKNNAVWGVMKNLKSSLNKMRRDYPKIQIFNPAIELGKDERVRLVFDSKVYFQFEDVQKIIDHKPESPKHQNVKLILLTLLFSGCRYSDVFKVIPKYHFDKDNLQFRYAKFITEKGSGVEVIIPILKPLEEAILENNGEMAYPISDQKFNMYVKELCQLAGLTEEIQLVFTSSEGKKKYDTKPFFQHVSSHIGRRTFISNLISAVPITLLSKVTGHSFNDKDVIYKYDKKTLLQNVVLFVKELQRVSLDRKDEFPIELV